jgi:hypothetical protein
VSETVEALLARVEAALAARRRLRRRPVGETIAALARAAARWREDAELAGALPAETTLAPAAVAHAIGHAADAIETG